MRSNGKLLTATVKLWRVGEALKLKCSVATTGQEQLQ